MAKRRLQRRPGTDWIITWPLLIVFAAMVFLTAEEIRNPRAEHASASAPTSVDWEKRLPERIDGLTHALQGSGLPLASPVEEPKGAGSLRWIHRRFEVPMASADSARLDASLEALKKVDPGVTVASHAAFDGVEVQVGLDGLLTHTLRVRWQERTARPRVAFVVGPFGDDLLLARQCVSIEAPLALLVRPFRPFSKEVAELGRIFKREVLVDLETPDGAALGSPSPTPPVEDALAQALASIPSAAGVSGMMPTREDSRIKLRDLVKERGLFFVAQAKPAAVGTQESPDAVFLLDEENESGMGTQIDRMVSRARGEGAAIGFGRSNAATISALGPLLEKLRQQEIDVVPVSSLAPDGALSAR
jgi:polysaccharide deacetylase 2 family uncharacterized protein YibQ